MDGLVEQVLSLCPDSDPDVVERDLNVTGDIEVTINHALDGLVCMSVMYVGISLLYFMF